MVKFETIGMVNDKGWVMGFQTLKVFEDFREAVWKKTRTLSPLQEIGFRHEANRRKRFEQRMEGCYQLTSRSLKGLCLIFGTPEEAIGHLPNPDNRVLLANPDTETTIRIAIHEGQVTSRVKTPSTTYVYSYPITQALLPTNLDLAQEFIEFTHADDRAFDHGDDGNVIVALECTRQDVIRDLAILNPWMSRFLKQTDSSTADPEEN